MVTRQTEVTVISNSFHLIVGDSSSALAEYATAKDRSAYLISMVNFTQKHKGTAYTSLGDLDGPKELFHLFSMANEITYYPPTKWSDRKSSCDKYSMAWLLEHYIGIAKNLFDIKVNFFPDKWKIPDPIESRKTDLKQLWVAGCSITFGIGVNPEERYANILSRKLDLPMSLLAAPSAAVPWAADQILRSDIRNGDIVVFGITTYHRYTAFKQHKLYHVNSRTNLENFPEFSLAQLESETQIYQCIFAVEQAINFCSQVGANLILIGIHANLELSYALSKHKNFIFLHGKFGTDFCDEWKDFGSDTENTPPHPGPLTHKMYADLIFSKAKELDFIR